MKELYETSSGAGEVSASALKTPREGNNLFITIFKTMGLFMLSQIFTCILMVVYIAVYGLETTTETNGFSFTFDIGNGTFDKDLILIMLFSEIFIVIIFILYAKFRDRLSLREIGFVTKKMPTTYISGVLGAILSMAAISGLCLLTGAFTIEKTSFSGKYMLLFAIGWLIQGLAEEVMCRGYLMTRIARRYSMPTAIIINSIVFALLHIFNPSGITPLAFINLCLYGIFASLMFLYSKNIWLCAGFHSIWNMVQGNVLGIPVSGVKVPSVFSTTFNEQLSFINGGSFGLEGGIGATAVLVLGSALLLLLIKNRK